MEGGREGEERRERRRNERGECKLAGLLCKVANAIRYVVLTNCIYCTGGTVCHQSVVNFEEECNYYCSL